MTSSPPPPHLLPSISMFTTGLDSPPFDNKPLTLLPKSYDSIYSNSRQIEKTLPSSEEVLAEKRRRNAGASARFRDRRKQRERELQEKCQSLEKRNQILENALKELNPEHPLIQSNHKNNEIVEEENQAIVGRINQLEQFISRFQVDKESDTRKLKEIEKEVSKSLSTFYNHSFIIIIIRINS